MSTNSDLGKLDWLSVAQAVHYTGASDYLIRQAVARGELVAYRFSGKTQLRRADLDEWMTPRRVKVSHNEPIRLDDIIARSQR